MSTIIIQSPLDQPNGRFRLLEELKNGLLSDDFTDFKFITAYSKIGPLLRLKPNIDIWKNKGKSISAAFGIDQKGTSKQALEFALSNFDRVLIANIGLSVFTPTFHPKIYYFSGKNRAIAYIGSNNLTVGGTESNSE